MRGCFADSYSVLSNRYGLALVGLDLAEEPEGLYLVAEVRPHLPLVGDWASQGARGAAAFDWSAARILRTLPRSWSAPPVAGYRAVWSTSTGVARAGVETGSRRASRRSSPRPTRPSRSQPAS